MRDTKTKNDHPHSFPLKLLKHLRPHNLSYGHETCSYLIQNISEAGNVYFGNNHTFTQSGWPQRHEVYGLDILIKIAGREFPAMIWQKNAEPRSQSVSRLILLGYELINWGICLSRI